MLQNRWKEMCNNLRGASPVKKVLSELDKTSGILRDILSPQFNKVVTDSAQVAREVESYIERIAPDKKDIVSTYNGNVSLFDHYGITKQIKAAFGRQVNTGTGASIIIEKTEACHVIDVNSGNRTAMEGDQESNALRVNMEAAEEISRQMRLRDLGGIIVIDFIDLKNPDNKRILQDKMRDLMELDRATHTILPLSKFNLMQITRERVRPEIAIKTTEQCPTCGGTGTIGSSLLLIDEIQADLDHLLNSHSTLKLYVHPIVEAYFKKGFPSIRTKWLLKYKRFIKIYSNETLGITEYQFFDENDEEIKLD
jgi:ribonuclease G